MSNAIQNIEAAIKAGTYPERVGRYRLYTLTTSERHLAAGADWHLIFSSNNRMCMDSFLEDDDYHTNPELNFHTVIDGEAA